MRLKTNKKGSALLMVVFLVSFLSALVMGMAMLNTEEIQLMNNHINSVKAIAIAEAGLNDALSEIREDPNWDAGIGSTSFSVGTYAVTMELNDDVKTLISTATTSQDFVARIEADITIGEIYPHAVRIDELRINRERYGSMYAGDF